MVTANSGAYRKNLTALEEATALFSAHEAGAARTRIRKATGRKPDQVKTALAAGGLSGATREQVTGLDRQLTLDELALMAEFEDDPDAMQHLVRAITYRYPLEHTAERIRQDRDEAAEHQRIRAELEAAGCPVTDEIVPGSSLLTSLAHDGDDLTPDNHRDCPGHGAFFRSHDRRTPAGPVVPEPVRDPAAEQARRLVTEGNKAWDAAWEVRKRWVAQLLARRTAPKEVTRFVAQQLLTMPDALRRGLPAAAGRLVFTDLTGKPLDAVLRETETCPAARVPLLALAPIAIAYEGEMAGEGERRNTWRTDTWAPCSRADAAEWLTFLASLGYQLAGIEQAVADDVPYTGDDTPADADASDPATPSDPDANTEPADPDTGDGDTAAQVGTGGDPADATAERDGYPDQAVA
ncbi:MAG TPA: hypothetical protein VF933_07410 [Streptosporangiaceae bacterium]